MYNIDDNITEMKKYFKKLFFVIENERSFSLLNTNAVNKKRIDDIMCCIESYIPKEYIEYRKNNGPKSLSSYNCYLMFVNTVRNTSFYFPNKYFIDVPKAQTTSANFINLFKSDMEKINRSL